MSTHLPLYTETSTACARLITKNYSTSFSLGIRCFDKKYRNPIYALYGFVRIADEIVDTFGEYDRAYLFSKFKEDTYEAIKRGISANPVLQAFQVVVNQYSIDQPLIDAFLYSMEMDLDLEICTSDTYDTYIYGSAEVVGLMCLKIFCEGDAEKYRQLEPSARKLGAAFQKVNFLRDLNSDYIERGRVYFPNVDFGNFSIEEKQQIEQDIQQDFELALQGIKRLPIGSKLGVYIAYRYYQALLHKIRRSSVASIKQERIRVRDIQKAYLLIKGTIKFRLNRI